MVLLTHYLELMKARLQTGLTILASGRGNAPVKALKLRWLLPYKTR